MAKAAKVTKEAMPPVNQPKRLVMTPNPLWVKAKVKEKATRAEKARGRTKARETKEKERGRIKATKEKARDRIKRTKEKARGRIKVKKAKVARKHGKQITTDSENGTNTTDSIIPGRLTMMPYQNMHLRLPTLQPEVLTRLGTDKPKAGKKQGTWTKA